MAARACASSASNNLPEDPVHLGQVLQHVGLAHVVRGEVRVLVDGERTPESELGPGVPPLLPVDGGEDLQAVGDVRVVGPQGPLVDRECPACLGLGELGPTLGPVDHRLFST
jgi:hypothetical protein